MATATAEKATRKYSPAAQKDVETEMRAMNLDSAVEEVEKP